MPKHSRAPSCAIVRAASLLTLAPGCSEYMPTVDRTGGTLAGTTTSATHGTGATHSGGSALATSVSTGLAHGGSTSAVASSLTHLGGSSAGQTVAEAGALQSGGATGVSSNGGSSAVVSGGASTGGYGAAAGSPSPTQVSLTATVSLDGAITYQTLEGFGAAIAWYHATLTGHAKSAELYRILFAELGLDILRFRNTYGRSEFADAVREKKILDAATASLGRRPKLLMTSWSPPAALKANGVEKCNGESTCTLKQDVNGFLYDEFAQYWVDALTAYGNAGVAPDWVSIQNEPDFIPYGWEGCKFVATESSLYPGYGKALEVVSAKFSGLSTVPKLIGPEVLGVHWKRMETYMPALNESLLWAAAHHLYERGTDEIWDWRSPGPDSYIPLMQSAKQAAGTLPILQTEFQTDEDNGIEGGFETAWLIHNSLVEEGVSGWLYWDLVWDAGHGLVSLPDTSSYVIRDQYYSLRHYARFTDPGDVRIGATASNASVRASAFRSPDQRRITVVVLNTGVSEERVGLDWGPQIPSSVEVHRTVYVPGSSETWAAQPALGSQINALILPSRSVSTVVLHL